MADDRVRALISLQDGRIELEGPENFVKSQLDLLQPIIERSFSKQTSAGGRAPHSPKSVDDSKPNDGAISLEAYENLFAIAEDKVQILKDIPGATKSEQMVNGALLLALAHKLMGTEPTAYDDVRDLCKAHGCLDATNLAKRLNAEKQAFIITGTGKSKALKLTVPGAKRAKAFADDLNGGDE
jgi:hypothetical protein